MTKPTTETIIFGGGFNPPTRAHTEVIEHCLAEPEIDEVWVMPSGARTDKVFDTTDEQRLEMLEIVKSKVFADEQRLVVSSFELQLPVPTETCRTLGALGIAYPDRRFWFTFGADAYHGMPDWEDGLRLQQDLPMFLLPRDGDVPPDAPNVRILPPLDPEISVISSTKAREVVGDTVVLEQFVPKSIAQYIAEQKLYRDLVVQ